MRWLWCFACRREAQTAFLRELSPVCVFRLSVFFAAAAAGRRRCSRASRWRVAPGTVASASERWSATASSPTAPPPSSRRARVFHRSSPSFSLLYLFLRLFPPADRTYSLTSGPSSPIIQERLMDQSDAYRIHVCESCGLIAVANLQKQEFECRSCRKGPQTRIVQARERGLLAVHPSRLPPLLSAPQVLTCFVSNFLASRSCCRTPASCSSKSSCPWPSRRAS